MITLGHLTPPTLVNLEKLREELFKISLPLVFYKLTNKKEGLGWENKKALDAIKHYKCFIFLCVKYQNFRLVPTKEIDEVWHLHILETRNYMSFCNKFFGEYIHHDTSLGVSQKSKKKLKSRFEKTKELWKLEFSSSVSGESSWCDFGACTYQNNDDDNDD